jgi:Zn-dependent protease
MLNSLSDPFTLLISIISFLFALSIHEAAHAWGADRLGDPTARLAGRLTLNPFAHLDAIGTLLLIFFGFGWGKPVPIDEFNLKSPRRDTALISLSGPLANLLVAILFSLIWWLTIVSGINSLVSDNLIQGLIQINIVLGIFNLLPLHPLDGGKILVGILPNESAKLVDYFLKRYGVFLLISAFLPIFSGRSLINIILLPIVNHVITLILFWLA